MGILGQVGFDQLDLSYVMVAIQATSCEQISIWVWTGSSYKNEIPPSPQLQPLRAITSYKYCSSPSNHKTYPYALAVSTCYNQSHWYGSSNEKDPPKKSIL